MPLCLYACLWCRPVPDAEAEGDDKDEAVAELEGESAEADAPKVKKKAGRKKATADETYQPEPRKPVPGWIQAQVRSWSVLGF